jgi:PAS domain S-box-containing protein
VSNDADPGAPAGMLARVSRRVFELLRVPARPRPGHAVPSWLAVAVDAMRLGVTVSDLDGRILYTNPAEAAMHGYDVAELIGQDVRVFAPPTAEPRRSGAQLRNAARWMREGWNVRKDGSRFPVRLVSDVLRDDQGAPMGIVTVSEDLTEQRAAVSQLEDQLRQAQKMEVLGQLSSGIAHDFNNLLSVIVTSLDLLDTTPIGEWESLKEDITQARAAARRGASMVRQLLAFGREQGLKLDTVDLGALVGDAVRVLQRLLPENVEVRAEAGNQPLPAIADARAVEQVLLNLGTNARDAMPDGGVLQLRCSRDWLDEEFRATQGWGEPGEYAALWVSDSGSGMDRATLRRVFEPFFTTKPPGVGTGLGLPMVYSIMKQHRGFVNVYSEPGEGTTVKLWFPIAREPGGRVERPAPVEELPRGTETILIVEDEPSLRRAAQRALERYGYSVIQAADGAEGWEVFQRRAAEIHIVLTDLVMPRLGGLELRERILSSARPIPVLVATGYSGRELKQQADLTQSVPLINKPWTMTELLRRVRGMLDGDSEAAPAP